MTARCVRCGKPPTGFATINDARYCHGDADERPTCYEAATIDAVRFPRGNGTTYTVDELIAALTDMAGDE